MRWPLRYQILLPMAGVILGTLLGVSALHAYLSARDAESRVQDQLRAVARSLREATFPLTEAVLSQTRDLSGVETVVTDPSGRVIAASRGALGALVSRYKDQTREPEAITLEHVIELEGQRYFHAVTELRGGRNTLPGSGLHVLYPEEDYRAALWRAMTPPLAVGAAAMVLVALLATTVASRVTRPLRRLGTQVEQIAEGNLAPMNLPRRNDEIRDLARLVNHMAARLAHYEAEVKRTERLRALGQITGGMAHQLRNAAAGCRIALDLYRREASLLGDSEPLDVALHQLALLEKYLQRFLSSPQSLRGPHSRIDLVEAVDGAVRLTRPAAEHRGIELDWQRPPEPIWIEGNADDLEQVAVNLLQNAIEAAIPQRGASAPRIEASLKTKRDGICFEVSDTGEGPPADLGDSLFDPLVSSKLDGTGLGLTVARDIARGHGGDVRFERRGEWTCFVVELPSANVEVERVEAVGRR